MPALPLCDRLLAEATCTLEELEPQRVHEPRADETGRAAGGDLEHRIVARAKTLSCANAIEDGLRHARQALALMIFIAAAVAVMAGIGAARAALASSRDEPVNFFWAIGTALGIQTTFLAVWILLALASASRTHPSPFTLSTASIGAMVVRAAQFLAGKIHRGPVHAAAFTAFARVMLGGRLGVWTISAITHGLWLAFNVACVASLMLMLSGRQYVFAWETTILSERQFVPMTEAIAMLPNRVGFPTPTRAQIDSSQWPFTTQPERSTMQAWSGLLIGAVLMYGLAPRMLLLGFSLGRRRLATQRFRLEVTRPAYAQLQSRLMPQVESIGIIDPDDGSGLLQARVPNVTDAGARPFGPPAIFGFELPAVVGGPFWPPAVHQVHWNNLGMVDTRDDQQRVVNALKGSITEPQSLIVVCALTTSPDRGVATFLAELMHTVHCPLHIILTGGDSLRRRTDAEGVARRVEDWRTLALQSGIQSDRVIEIDLEHVTQATSAKLAAIVSGTDFPHAASPARLIERAFDTIAKHAESWLIRSDAPTLADEAELHRQIAKAYDHQGVRWRDLIAAPSSLGVTIADQMKSGSDRFLALLPPRLKASPRWVAAGAVAGAMGCIAAATLVAPVAISALPMWAVVGGAVSAAIMAIRSSTVPARPADASTGSDRMDDPVRAAALFAVLLELQGRDEAAITRILDRTIDEDLALQGSPLNTADQARLWLDHLRHRFDLVLAQESSS